MTVVDEGWLDRVHLDRGSHTEREQGMCLLEVVAYVAGEPHSDHPKCASPVLAAMGRELNDRLDDTQRQRLIPLVPLLVGTVDPEQDQVDGLRCAHWCVTHWVPTWLDLVPSLAEHATALRALPAPGSWEDVASWTPITAWSAEAARSAEAAAEAAVWSAAWSAATAGAALQPTADRLRDDTIALYIELVTARATKAGR